MLMQNSIMNRHWLMVVWHKEKTKIMKPKITNQEILLFTGTSFTWREFCSSDATKEGERQNSPLEQLEKACWGGLLCSLLPEIVTCNSSRTESFIWNILHGKNFLYIAMGQYPEMADNETTIDPYFCTMSRCEN